MKLPRTLAAEWARKLAESGFEDLEHPRFQDGPLRRSRRQLHEEVAATAEQRAAYRTMALRFARRKSLTDQERSVWLMHAEGATYAEIAAAHGLKSKHRPNDIVNRLRDEMLGGQSDKGGERLPTRGNKKPLQEGRWLDKAIRRMDDETLAQLLPAFLEAFQRQTSRRSSRRRSRSCVTTSGACARSSTLQRSR